MAIILHDYSLSEEQQAAVLSDARAIVVVASAGSGKTEVVARRVERLLVESPEQAFRILALSYTVKAADELSDRFRERLGALHSRVDTNTVHGFAHALLRQHGTRIGLPVEPEVLVRDEDRAELLSRWLSSAGRPIEGDLDGVFQRLDLARARCEPAPMLDEWEAALTAAGALDYASMLSRAVELLQLPSARRQLSRLYGHLIVDEAQNLTPAQYALLTALIGFGDGEPPHVPTMVVGDDKQSIVSFAGADPRLIGRFEADYKSKRFELTQNFRSASAIAAIGDAVARELTVAALPGSGTSYAAPGLIERFEGADETAEAGFVAEWVERLLAEGVPADALAPGETPHVRPEDIAVLSRSAAPLRFTRGALEAAGVPVAIASSPDDWLATLPGRVVLELLALRSAADHKSTHWQLARLLDVSEATVEDAQGLADVLRDHPDESVRLVAPLCEIDTPSEFIVALSKLAIGPGQDDRFLAAWEGDCQQLLEAWRSFEQQASVVEQTWGNFRLHISRQQRGDAMNAGVRLLTIHKAQGREYRAVALIGLNDGQLPDFRATNRDDQVSELRTFYVAVTRASRLLLVTRPSSRDTRYGPRPAARSGYWSFLDAAT